MVKKSKAHKKDKTFGEPVAWLPFDSRLIPDIFSFGHIKGIAKVFLSFDIILSVLVVIGTLILLFLSLFS